MSPIHRLLLLLLAVLINNPPADAQNGKKLRDLPPETGFYLDQCHLCDSLAEVYLSAGDTSMAIYYYQQYADAHPEDLDKKGQLTRQTRFYNRRQSFYLTDH